MNKSINISEFDQYADDYYTQHAKNISLSGESPDYFAEYKLKDVKMALGKDMAGKTLLDFGCGIGNSIPYFNKYFPGAKYCFADVSRRSLEIASSRFPAMQACFSLITNDRIDLADNSVDVVFTACVFHHIDHVMHDYWLKELKRVIKPGGQIFIFEHNPYNPLTLRAVNTCPFDVNARLIRAKKLKHAILRAGWSRPVVKYRIFFPKALAYLRGLERYMHKIPLGAQYYVRAKK